ncbi:MAG: hypothetical protein R6U28_04300 [Cyclonatronaceae bacterium]
MTLPAIPLLTRKKILLVLLAASCLLAFVMLLLPPDNPPRPLPRISLADSLILDELTRFHIGEEHIRTFEYEINEDFTRKRYVVTVPPGISQTHLHAELNRKFRTYKVRTIGFVNVPERETQVMILFEDTIIRSLELRTDAGRSARFNPSPHPAFHRKYGPSGRTGSV